MTEAHEEHATTEPQNAEAPPAPPPAPPPRNSTREEVDTAGYWDQVYAEAEAENAGAPGWDLGAPNPELVWQLDNAVPRIAPGKIAVPGCGFGNDAIELARRGFDVTAMDFSPRAVAGARKRIAAAGLRAECIEADIFKLPAHLNGSFDYIYEYTCFCAIHPERRAEYAAVCAGLLKPGGQLIGCFYWHGKEAGPPYNTPPEAVREAFGPLFDCRMLAIAQHSVERRAGTELWARFAKR